MKILLPLDESPSTEQILSWLPMFLPIESVDIYLMTVVNRLPSGHDWPENKADGIQDAILLMNRSRSIKEGKGFRVVETFYDFGPVAERICAYADEKGIDQIIMASHSHHGIGDLLMGRVSKTVFQQAHQPVLVLNTGQRPSLEISRYSTCPIAQKSEDL